MYMESDDVLLFFFLRKVTLQVPVSVCPDHPSEVPEKLIQDRFRKLGRFPEAFSSIHYKGTRTYNPPTDFSGLRRALEQQLENNTTRSPRHPGVIFKALKVSWLLPWVLLLGVPVDGENSQFSRFCWCWWLKTWAGRKEGLREKETQECTLHLLNVLVLLARGTSAEESWMIVKKWHVLISEKK